MKLLLETLVAIPSLPGVLVHFSRLGMPDALVLTTRDAVLAHAKGDGILTRVERALRAEDEFPFGYSLEWARGQNWSGLQALDLDGRIANFDTYFAMRGVWAERDPEGWHATHEALVWTDKTRTVVRARCPVMVTPMVGSYAPDKALQAFTEADWSRGQISFTWGEASLGTRTWTPYGAHDPVDVYPRSTGAQRGDE